MNTCIVLGTGDFAEEIAAIASQAADQPILCAWRSASQTFRTILDEPMGFTIGQIGKLLEYLVDNNVESVSFAGHVSLDRDVGAFDDTIIDQLKRRQSFTTPSFLAGVMSALRATNIRPVPIKAIYPQFGPRAAKPCSQDLIRRLIQVRKEARNRCYLHLVESAVIVGSNVYYEEQDGTDALIDAVRSSDDKGYNKVLIKLGHRDIYPMSCPVIGPHTIEKCIQCGIQKVVVDEMIAIARPAEFYSSVDSRIITIELDTS